jgi:hypothetical protein
MTPDLFGVGLAVVVGLTQVVKKAGVNTRYIPLVAIAFGILYVLAVSGVNVEAFIQGTIVGLTSVGAYRTVEKTVE